MEPLQVAEKLKEKFPEEVLSVEEFRGQVSVTLKKDRILDICRYMHAEPGLEFDLLRDLCGVDYLGRKTPRFEVVYHLYSLKHRNLLRLKAQVSQEDCRIASVVPVWTGVNWHERECFDMYGIVFEGHPDLRRILMPEDWQGHPQRKDYPLKSDLGEMEWQGYKDIVDMSRRYKEFGWNRQ